MNMLENKNPSLQYLLKGKQIVQTWQVFALIYLIANEDSGAHIFGFCDTIWNNPEEFLNQLTDVMSLDRYT